MTLKEFLASFDLNHPDFSAAPADFPNSSLSGLTSAEVGKFLAAKTEWEISRPPQPDQRSRQSQTPNGYIFLVAWSNACLLRILMVKWFRWYRVIHGYNKGFYGNLQDFKGANDNSDSSSKLLQNPVNSSNFAAPFPLTSPKSPLNSFTPAWLNPKLLDRLEAQLLDALRSTIANIEEGYGRPTTIEYLNFLGYTQASLKEAKGDVQRMKQDGLLASKPGSKLADLGIDLAAWHAALKKSVISTPPLTSLKSPLNSSNNKGLYRNLEDSTGQSTKFLQNPVNSSNFTPDSSPLTSPKPPLNSFSFTQSGSNPQSPSSASSPLTSPKPPLNSSNFGQSDHPAPPLTSPKFPLNSFNFNYSPIGNFDPSQLTYEMLIELINKTDWNLRQLVGSLETKLNFDQKAFQIERARIRGKVNWRR